ncbi:hypothetical protein WMY93_009870 [Mugilogobius chulae]|uniref:G-protein coupled receptors family 1 profile domain-containing protein n=1 Tax=Mugilogobius chulae TaxID=88201 RepID=A0AAW0PBH8_9GOBI
MEHVRGALPWLTGNIFTASSPNCGAAVGFPVEPATGAWPAVGTGKIVTASFSNCGAEAEPVPGAMGRPTRYRRDSRSLTCFCSAPRCWSEEFWVLPEQHLGLVVYLREADEDAHGLRLLPQVLAFGEEGCRMHGFQGMISVLASISFMAAIAWDRYHVYCTRQKLFWSTTVTMSCIIWILSVAWAAVPLFGWGVYDFEPMKTCCTLDYSRGDRDYITYMWSLVVLYLAFPSFTMLSCYDSIFKYFKKIHNQKFNTSLPLQTMLMCWGPYVLMCVIACFTDVTVVSPRIRMALPVIAKTNPIFNALIYTFNNEFYRPGVWNFLTGQKITEPLEGKKGK